MLFKSLELCFEFLVPIVNTTLPEDIKSLSVQFIIGLLGFIITLSIILIPLKYNWYPPCKTYVNAFKPSFVITKE